PIEAEGLDEFGNAGDAQDELPAVPWTIRLRVFGSFAFLMINAQAFCRAFCYAFFNSWFPPFLERAHSLPVAGASALNMLPLAGYATGALIGGPLIDGVLRRTGNKWQSRSLVGAAALILAGLASLAAIGAGHPTAAVLALTVGTVVSGFAAPA